MQPSQLTAEHFVAYPPLARQVATRGLDVLRRLPLSFVPLLLGEVIAYDSKFPAERQEVDAQFSFMSALSLPRLKEVMARFERLSLARELEEVDWVGRPGEFSERLSAHLWTTSQIADFRTAAVEFLNAVRSAIPPPEPAVPRLTIVVIGRDAKESSYPLFRKLRPHGTYFSQVDPANGLRIIMQRAAARAKAHPLPFAHWYIDGGIPASPPPEGMELLAYPAAECRSRLCRREAAEHDPRRRGNRSETERPDAAHSGRCGPERRGAREGRELLQGRGAV